MPDTPLDPTGPPEDRTRVSVSTTSILLAIAAVVAAVAARGVFIAAHRVIGWVIACIVVTVLLDPIVEFLGRFLKRGLAIVLVFLAIAGIAGGLLAGTYENLRRQVDRLEVAAPEAAARLEDSERFGELATELRLEERVTDFVEALDERVGSGATVVRSAVGTIPTYFVCAILVIFFLFFGPRIVGAGFAQIQDEAKRVRWQRIASQAVGKARGYVLAVLVQAMIVGLVAYTVLRLCEVPLAFVLAVLIGAFSVIPYFGIVLGSLPALLIAAGLRNSSIALVLLLTFIGLQAVEALEIRRRVDAWTVRVGPAAVVIALLMGYAIYGIGGALYGGAIAVFGVALADAAATSGAPTPPSIRL